MVFLIVYNVCGSISEISDARFEKRPNTTNKAQRNLSSASMAASGI